MMAMDIYNMDSRDDYRYGIRDGLVDMDIMGYPYGLGVGKYRQGKYVNIEEPSHILMT